MKNSIILLLSIILLSTLSHEAEASHASGAEFRYECIGSDQYIITYIFYRDCSGIPAPYIIDVQYSSSCDSTIYTVNLPLSGPITQVSPLCPSAVSICDSGTYVGIQKYIYSDTITLPSPCSDWRFSHSEPARSTGITTIYGAGSANLYVFCLINNTQNFCQSSPRFTSELTPFITVGQNSCVSPGTFLSNGDSIVYEQIVPLSGGGYLVSFLPGYSYSQPILSNPICSFDSLTGNFCCTPTQADVSILAVVINQFRNGILIGQVERDFQITVLNSVNHLVSVGGFAGTNQDTLNVCEGEIFNSWILASDADAIDTTNISLHQINSTGINFSTTDTYRDTLHINWTPTQADIASSPHCFTVIAKDNYCPYYSITERTFCLNVIPSGTGSCVPNSIYSLEEDPLVKVYPNPSGVIVTIDYRRSEKLESFDFFDLMGRRINSRKDELSSPVQIDLQNFDSGIYFLQLNFGSMKEILKLVKE